MNTFFQSLKALSAFVFFLTHFVSSGFSACEDQLLVTHVFMNNREHYATDESRIDAIKHVCADPKVSCIDLSLVGLIDRDLDDIYDGLVEREISGSQHSLMLLNIESDNITEGGLKNFLCKLQKGSKKENKRIIPDLRNTIIKIGFPITHEFVQELQAVAPSVFAGSLRLVY